MVKVCFIIDCISTPHAGTEKHLISLISGLDRKLFTPTLVCLRSSEYLKELNLNCELIVLNIDSIARPGLLGDLLRFKRMHKDRMFDILVTYFVDSNVFGVLAGLFCGIKCRIATRRNVGYWHSPFTKLMLRSLRFFTSAYVANSHEAVEVLKTAEWASVDMAYLVLNGVEVDSYARTEKRRALVRKKLGIKDGEVAVVLVGNLRKVKNIPMAIHVSKELLKRGLKTKFFVAGAGAEEESLCSLIAELEVQGVFSLMGRIDDVPMLLSGMDIGISTSNSEGLSNSVLEFMAAGLPVVLTETGEGPSIVRECRCGFVVPVGDSINFSRRLLELIDARDQRIEMGRRGMQWAERFHSEAGAIKEYERIFFLELAKTKGKEGP